MRSPTAIHCVVCIVLALGSGVGPGSSAFGQFAIPPGMERPTQKLSGSDLTRLAEINWYRASRGQSMPDLTDGEQKRDMRIMMSISSMRGLPAVYIDPDRIMRNMTVLVGLSEAQAAAARAALDRQLAEYLPVFEQRIIAAYRRSLKQSAIEDGAYEGDLDITEHAKATAEAGRAIRGIAGGLDGWASGLEEQLTDAQRRRMGVLRAYARQSMLLVASQLDSGRHGTFDSVDWVCERLASGDRPFLPTDAHVLELAEIFAVRNRQVQRAAALRMATIEASVALRESTDSGNIPTQETHEAYLRAQDRLDVAGAALAESDDRVRRSLQSILGHRDRRALLLAHQYASYPSVKAVRPTSWDRLWDGVMVEAEAAGADAAVVDILLSRLDEHDAPVEAAWGRFLAAVEKINSANEYSPLDVAGNQAKVRSVTEALADAHRIAAEQAELMVEGLHPSAVTHEDLADPRFDALRTLAMAEAAHARASADTYAAKSRDGDIDWARGGILGVLRRVLSPAKTEPWQVAPPRR